MPKTHMIHKQLFVQFISLLMIALLCLTQLIVVFPFHANAQANKNLSPKDYVKLYEAVTFFGVCIQKTGLILNRSNAEVSAFEVFGSRPNSINHQESMGFILENDDGRLKCLSKGDQDIAKNALGLDAKAILIESGLYKPNGDNTGTGYVVAERDDGLATNKLISYLGGKVGIDATGELSKGQQYFALQATFEKLCKKEIDNIGGREVKTVDDQGNVVKNKYSLTDQLDDNYPIGYGIPSPAGQEMNCSDIINRLNDQTNIDEAVKIQKAFISKGGNPNPTPGQNGVATATCESNNNNVLLSWILCGVVNAIDDSITKITQSVDGLLDVNKEEYDNPSIKAIWSYFKNLASFLLVGVALIVIVGQAVNRE